MTDHADAAAQRKGSWLVRFFWPIFAAGVVVVVAAIVWGFKLSADDYDSTRKELNANYVEKIGLKSTGGRFSRMLPIIDGVSRYDCTVEDGLLDCDDDPQPTLEDSPKRE